MLSPYDKHYLAIAGPQLQLIVLLIIFTISNPNSLPCVQYRTTKCSFMNTNQVIMLSITSKKVQAHGRRLYPDYR